MKISSKLIGLISDQLSDKLDRFVILYSKTPVQRISITTVRKDQKVSYSYPIDEYLFATDETIEWESDRIVKEFLTAYNKL